MYMTQPSQNNDNTNVNNISSNNGIVNANAKNQEYDIFHLYQEAMTEQMKDMLSSEPHNTQKNCQIKVCIKLNNNTLV